MHCTYPDYIPRRKTMNSAGYDFFSPVSLSLEPGTVYDIDTGVYLDDGDLKTRQCMELSARSSMRKKAGMQIVGLIDSDYRGSIHALVTVLMPYQLEKGDRFMQGSVREYFIIPCEIAPVDKRDGGLGSTGE